ncbi:hypothetical protein [Joostella sp.]|uniref:hypothetical protein n=1 Tax=Joostella sp. TaxID=2231138 RepID=UPI003A9563E8
MSSTKIIITGAVITLFSISLTSCSNDRVAYQDGIYYNQGVKKANIEMPSNG